ncbi:MAG: hypothetical protein H6908_02410 [Hyphomicrobiales bacterium]|nr:hypothetical protein [Hyphomicrobiales bacterium]
MSDYSEKIAPGTVALLTDSNNIRNLTPIQKEALQKNNAVIVYMEVRQPEEQAKETTRDIISATNPRFSGQQYSLDAIDGIPKRDGKHFGAYVYVSFHNGGSLEAFKAKLTGVVGTESMASLEKNIILEHEPKDPSLFGLGELPTPRIVISDEQSTSKRNYLS